MINYVIISPVRNEEQHIEKTITSVINQTIKPTEWVLVNDGSSDRTKEIILSYAEKNPLIRVVDIPDRGYRLPGKGIVDAFYKGKEQLQEKDWEYIVKLDCDLSFEPTYFENIYNEFSKNKSLGIASGKTYLPIDGNTKNLKLEWCPDTSARGASKIYKRNCFEDIGGIRKERGWDTLDNIAAMVEGYEVRSFGHYQIIHYRPIGTRTMTHKGMQSNFNAGKNYYYIGYHPVFMFLKAFKVMFTDKPVILAGISMFWGYFISFISRAKRVDDKRLIKKLQEVQLNRLKTK